MNNAVSTDNKSLRRQGARLTVLSAIIGCILFVVIETLPLLTHDLSGFSIGIIIAVVVFVSLFSLPFSILGGNALGWFLEKTGWYKQGIIRVIASGVIIASATLMLIFVIGGFLQLCLMAHLRLDVFVYIIQAIVHNSPSSDFTEFVHLFVSRFTKALLIAAVCGGITAWRLSRLAQQKPA